jgi:16S rRNA (guanine(966)-N(2))-methyltransferase RsmD
VSPAVNRPAARLGAVRRHEVRIIGGQWRRSRLAVPDLPGLRPTPDRIRETLFNWLGQDLTGWRCLDAFAGTGALGFEAASRGAQRVLMIEREARLAATLRETASRLGAHGIEVLAADALGALGRQTPGSFDLVLLDPPYGSGLLARALGLAPALLAERGLIYAEDARDPVPPPGWRALRRTRAGAVHAALLAREPVAADTACPIAPTDSSASPPSP